MRAVIWDVDGTIAETERDGHRVAFNRAFTESGLSWHWSVARYGELLATAGGHERLLRDMDTRPEAPPRIEDRIALARSLHTLKNAFYAALIRQGVVGLRPGVARLMAACDAQSVDMAIATTTSRSGLDALLESTLGPRGASRFVAIVTAEDAPRKKPDPQAYRVALERLGCPADEAVAIEDSPNGVLAARACGIATLVTRSDYFREACFVGAAAFCDDLDSCVRWEDRQAARVDLEVLRRLVATSFTTGSPGPRRDP